MPDSQDHPHHPAQFAAALDAIRSSSPRPELVVTEIAAPGNLAPYSIALAADVTPVRHGSDSDFGTGRFILLYDPEEPDSWGGPFRVVCFAQAPLETDIGVDPFLAEVAWAWLVDALDTRGANYAAASGTATKILSSGFGELAHQGDGAQIELRASWSPLDNDLAAHVEGWAELLCMLAGLPPAGESPVPPRHGHPSDAGTARHGYPAGADSRSADRSGGDDAGPDKRGANNRGMDIRGAHQDGANDYSNLFRAQGIALGAVDRIGPRAVVIGRTGPVMPTLGVAADGHDLPGRTTVGVELGGLDTFDADSAGRESPDMSTIAVKTIGIDTGTGARAGVRSRTFGAPARDLPSVADLSARRAARG